MADPLSGTGRARSTSTPRGIETVDVGDAWLEASEYSLTYNPALGDAFALAAAETLDATLLVGGDGDYDEVPDVPIKRFRDEPE